MEIKFSSLSAAEQECVIEGFNLTLPFFPSDIHKCLTDTDPVFIKSEFRNGSWCYMSRGSVKNFFDTLILAL